jgi:hypothetical protein
MFTVPRLRAIFGVLLAASLLLCVSSSQAQNRKTNIVFIMGDDVGWSNIGVYNQGIMAGRTPNLDKLASQGMPLHRLLCGSELHCRSGKFHNRRTPNPNRTYNRRSSGIASWHAC